MAAAESLSPMERSKDKSCGVCFEVIVEKPQDARFGILPNCNHCFCLSCIMKWRQEKQLATNIIRACPECRIPSDFVCPSRYWVDTKDEKQKLLETYKNAMGSKPCKHFDQGRRKCPFGNKCFYLHALPNGKKIDVGPPVSRPRRNRNVHIRGFDFTLSTLSDLMELNHLFEDDDGDEDDDEDDDDDDYMNDEEDDLDFLDYDFDTLSELAYEIGFLDMENI